MLFFSLITAKSHRPIVLAYAAVRSDSVTLIQIIGRLSRLRLPCVCHPCQLLLDKFIANLRLRVALIVLRINIWYVLSFIFYHKFLKKSSLYVLTSCEITKKQEFCCFQRFITAFCRLTGAILHLCFQFLLWNVPTRKTREWRKTLCVRSGINVQGSDDRWRIFHAPFLFVLS